MEFGKGDRVKDTTLLANRIGTVVGIYEEDKFIESNGEIILFASKGEFQIRFDNDKGDGIVPMHGSQLEKVDG